MASQSTSSAWGRVSTTSRRSQLRISLARLREWIRSHLSKSSFDDCTERDGNRAAAALHQRRASKQAAAQPSPQARARPRAVAAVLPRQFAPRAILAACRPHIAGGHRVGRARRHLCRDGSLHGGRSGRARGVVRADPALPIMPLVTAIIVLVFGSLTLLFHDEHLIKLKPTIIYVSFGAV